jgi:phosphohistidine swiveling domain-containing protein
MKEEGFKNFKKIAYLSVASDFFHFGHFQAIKFAKSISEYLVCGVLSSKDTIPERGARPLSTLEERKEFLSGLKFVDKAIPQEETDPTENLKKIHKEFPDAEVILIHDPSLKRILGEEYIKKIKGQVIPHQEHSRLPIHKKPGKLIAKPKQDLFSNKINLLNFLKDSVKKSLIEDFFYFTSFDWNNNKNKILENIKKRFSSDRITIENSKNKIKKEFSLENNLKEVENYIEKLIKKKNSRIIIQALPNNISVKINTFTKNSGEPYCVINYDSCLDKKSFNFQFDEDSLKILFKNPTNKYPKIIQNIFLSVKEIQEKFSKTDLDLDFAVSEKNKITLLDVKPLFKKFIHAWGGTTSIQSLECHTLRYVKFPNRIANHIHGSVLCEIRDKHHTVFFDEKDIECWNREGARLFDKNEQEKIIKENLEQIQRTLSFFKEYENKDFSKKTNKELLEVYNKLMNLIMENGSFFPYSREDVTSKIKEKILSFLEDKKDKLEIFQFLTTPTQKDIFLEELIDKSNLLRMGSPSDKDLHSHAKKHPWRFINTYSKEKVRDFLKQELLENNPENLEKEIQSKLLKIRELKEKQDDFFRKIDSILFRDLCIFLQEISVIRLKNKFIWAGYEFLFLDLFKEIAERLGLTTEDYLSSYRINDTKSFLKNRNKLPLGEVEKRKTFFNLEISNNFLSYSYTPNYFKKSEKLSKNIDELKGESGNLGKVIGRALVVTEDSIETLMKIKKEMSPQEIYITTMTHPAMASILHDVLGIVTDEGGITSHASIISRELGIPCLVGTRNATGFFKTGDIIELDTYNRKVRKLSEKEAEEFNILNKNKVKKISNNNLLTISKKIPDSSVPYTINFKDKIENPPIGGKAQNLFKSQKIHKIPEFFCLTRRIFDEIMYNILEQEIVLDINNLDELRTKLKKIREDIKNYTFNNKFTNEILGYFNSLNSEYVAVRSSGSCEDSLKKSFAGQFQSFLGIDKNNLIHYIKKCLASTFKENAVFYLINSGMDFSDFYMGVIVQKFLPSQKSGVFFTENPSDPHKKAFCIDANFGVGESVVSGKTKPDRYIINEKGILAFVSNEKEVYNYNKNLLTITKENKRVLRDFEIQQLVRLGKLLLEFFDTEIEYEWCFFNDILFLLQVRPITTKFKNQEMRVLK